MYYNIKINVRSMLMPINSFDNYPMGWKPDPSRLKRPYYQSIAELLENDINSGYITPDTKLPPQRELADYLDLNFTTITRAYKLCERRGLIYTITGSGTFVSPHAAKSITISAASDQKQLIELGMVHSFEQTNSLVNETIKKVGHLPDLDVLINYNYPNGLPHHRQAGLTWMAQFGIHVDLEHLSIVSGSQNALAIALTALFEPGDYIATDYLTYSNFIELARILHFQLLPVPMDDNGILPAELIYLCNKFPVKGIYLMPCCNNPTAIEMTDQRKKEISDIIEKYQMILIEDDTMAFLSAAYNPDKQPIFQLIPEQSVYICGTGKSICSGLRIAYIVYGDRFSSKIRNSLYNINVKTSSLDAEIISRLIVSGKANKICNEKIKLSQNANDLFKKYFPDVILKGNPYSFFRFIPLASSDRANKCEAYLQELGVRVFSTNRFLTSNSKNYSGLRIALSSTHNMDELENGLRIVSNYLRC